MPLPEALQTLLAAQKNFDPAAERDEFTSNRPLWRLYLDLYELDETKLKTLVRQHSAEENADKFATRQALAAVFNLVPMVVNLTKGYLFSESPSYEVQDEDLKTFLRDCDGAGRSFEDFTKDTVLPMAQVLGWVDVLIENPAPADGAAPLTQADAAAAKLHPHVTTVTPLQRTHWSAKPNHGYNWLRFRDAGNESDNPFTKDVAPAEAYVTYGVMPHAAEEGKSTKPTAFFFRSFRKPLAGADEGTPPASTLTSTEWQHDGAFTPIDRVPVATLYHQRSNDPEPGRRHFGLSKIAMIAVLTRQIVQVLSWTNEDVLANLSLFTMPSRNGLPLKDENGNLVNVQFGANTILWFDRETKFPPMVLQGQVQHIEIKLRIVELYIREILRIANLLTASGSAGSASGGEASAGGKANSGVQAEIERNELFRELTETSAALDAFALESLALAKSWITNEAWSVQRLTDEGKVSVRHYKGPWSLDPVDKVIATANEALALFRQVSPTASESAYAQAARSLLHNNGSALQQALKEIKDNTGKVMEEENERLKVIAQAEADAAKAGAAAAAGETEAADE